MSVRDYLSQTRSLGYSLLAVLPLVVVYAVLTLASGERPGSVLSYLVDAILGAQPRAVRDLGVLILGAVLVVAFYVLGQSGLRKSRTRFISGYLPVMATEAGVFAALLGVTLNAVPRMMIIAADRVGDVAYEVMLAVGAGLFEELVFRLMLLGFLVFVFTRLRQFPLWTAYLLALVITSIAFAVAHYLHVRKGLFDAHVFLLRQVAGVFFGLIYCLRGFGVAVYTHTWYDLLVAFS